MVVGRLQMYDYGLMGNLAHYRQITPPAYNLKNVVTPVVMIYGKGDPIAPPEVRLLDLLHFTWFFFKVWKGIIKLCIYDYLRQDRHV